ncbi:MAG: 50S ribosomal protein L3 [Candidatus Aenigmarchaeota archaeon ex4484_52]|nr:MAG: 50S ribosomal protein L3 [Candidatus Aenigmarchaeota archaeon ex4484_52]
MSRAGENHPRRGSLAFRPKKRSKRIFSKIKCVKQCTETKILEFAGYKAGMTYIKFIQNQKETPNYGKKIITPVTIIETPDLFVCGFRIYLLNNNLGKYAFRDILTNKKQDNSGKIKEVEEKLKMNKIKEIKLIVQTQPKLTGFNKKKPEIFESFIGGKTIEDKLNYAKQIIGKNISIMDFENEGNFIDVSGVTKGHGFTGSVKRWGVKLLAKKSQKIVRKAGTLGPWHPAKTQATVPQMGQYGYFNRMIYNLQIMKIIEKNQKDEVFDKIRNNAFKNYGLVKSNYIVVRGSVMGPPKRLIRLRHSIRNINAQFDENINILQ